MIQVNSLCPLFGCGYPDLSVAKWLWKIAIPSKLQFFGWLAWQGRVKTTAFLHRIGMLPADASTLCVFCRSEVESVSHVLLHCPLVWKVWAAMLSWWDVCWATLSSIVALLQWWSGIRFKKKVLYIWKIVPLVVLWSIWKFQNEIVFNNGQANFSDLVEVVKLRVVFWAKSCVPGLQYSVHDFLFNLQQIRMCL